MAHEESELSGRDLTEGVSIEDVAEGLPLLGHAGGEPVVLARSGGKFFAVGATCTHYSAPLADGIVTGGNLRCPWHHACFDLRTGEAVRAPAFAPVACYRVEVKGGRVRVGERQPEPPVRSAATGGPSSVVIVGAGAAAYAAADTLRREGFRGRVTLIGAEETGPVDRPNLSKEFLTGKAPEEWIPLAIPEGVELRTGTRVTRIDTDGRRVLLADGSAVPWDALLLATGAEVVRLEVPGSDLPHVHTLRTFADSKAIIEGARTAKRAVVVGAGFIGLEAAASLRERGLSVDVIAPASPLEKVLGPEIGRFLKALHEEHGVAFHIGDAVASISKSAVRLKSGLELAADLVVVGIGVRPATGLAEGAGLRVDHGLLTDERLETSAKGIFAAGDVARWRDARFGGTLRVEHWVAAERMGAAAARAILGRPDAFRDVPFFWSAHYDVTLAYVGHAERWDRIDVHGSLAARDATLAYRDGDTTLAVVTVGRDRTSLAAEVAFEGDDRAALGAFGRTM
jgi:NADPH-dependent 2,4-dienoyl-CoA reductase/sulfur reductase-like enzyme/nitrite reductase/ring-hydroxylating ferredoxin subunit